MALADSSLYAINGQTGNFEWSFGSTDPIYASPVLDADGSILFVASSTLYKMSPAGAVIWSVIIGFVRAGSPVIAPNGNIYIGTAFGALFAISRAGTVLFQYSDGCSASLSSPVVAQDNGIVVGCTNGTLFKVTAAGTPVWAVDVGNVPAIAMGPDGTFFMGTNSATAVAVSSGK